MASASRNHRQAPDPFDGLPAAEQAEKLILGSIMVNGANYGNVAATLAAEDFLRETHQRIFRRMGDMHRRGEQIDRPLLVQELINHHELENVGGIGYLLSLDDGMPVLPNIDGYIRAVRDMAIRRRAVFGAHRIYSQLLNTSTPIENIQNDVARLGEALAAADNTEAPSSVPQWPVLGAPALYGLAGDLVRLIEPHTESDPAALLMQFLAGFGNLIGRGPYYVTEADRQHTNLYVVITGASSKARKGTSWGRILQILSMVDEHWADNCLLSGIGSGEVLIDALDNEDHRRLITEGELARILSVMNRDGQTLSPILRSTWDTGRADSMTVGRKERHVRGAHLSLIAHITNQELVKQLNAVELANGLANRILFCCARRSKLLPFGGGDPDLGTLARDLSAAVGHARRLGQTRMNFDDEAKKVWASVYSELSTGKPGLLGNITNRGEVQTPRLCVIYAMLDRSDKIRPAHVKAALACWNYCAASAAYIWGTKVGDPVADKILAALQTAANGLTKTEISGVFHRKGDIYEIERALNLLTELGMIRSQTEETAGRAATRFIFER